MYIFSPTREEVIAKFWDQMACDHQNWHTTDRGVRRALVALVELACLPGQTPPATPEPSDQFRQESAAALLAFPAKLGAYSDIALFMAEGAREDDWYELCIRRSVIQVLWDDYAGTPVAALITPADVADLDVELRRVGAAYGPMPAEGVPAGLPAHHWWWRYPTPDAGTDTAA